MREKNTAIRDLLGIAQKAEKKGDTLTIRGWIKSNRLSGRVGFMTITDGSCFKPCQVVYDANNISNFEETSRIGTGCTVEVLGTVELTPEMKQPFDFIASEITLLGGCDPDYPLQKNRIGLDKLREMPHLRPKTNTFQAVFKVRSDLSLAIHEFFKERGFLYITTPIITGNDAEGAGEVFTVTTRADNDYEKDFFGKHASLTVSGQLHVEPFALAYGNVYTFGPTFRAENSNTSYHASEFWMIEPEIAGADLNDDMALIEDMVKYCIDYVLNNSTDEMQFLNDFIDPKHTLIEDLKAICDSEFEVYDYTDAVDYLSEAISKGVKFEFPVFWGMDLKSEHERYLCETRAKGPLFIINYPKEIKSFYMRLNDDGKTVAACDLLVPGAGELIGGAQREERYDMLVKRMEEMNIPLEPLSWYADLRRFGTIKHAGFGFGLERMMLFLTRIGNIRDTIPYARTPNNMRF